MYWTIGKYQQEEEDELLAPPPLVLWRIISGPHRSRDLAGEHGEWAMRREIHLPAENGWHLKSYRVVRAAHLRDYGLVNAASSWGLTIADPAGDE